MRWRTELLLAALGLGCSFTPSDPPPNSSEAAAETPELGTDAPAAEARGSTPEPQAGETELPEPAVQTGVATSRALKVGTLPEACRPPAGSVPKVEVGEPGQGSAAQEWVIVQRVVRKHRPAFDHCGPAVLSSGESECSGHTFPVRLVISPDGSAHASHPDTAAPSEHERCVLDALAGLTFPQRRGTLTVTGPVVAY